MSDYFSDLMGMLWVQPEGPNTECYPLFCHDVDGLDSPAGDVSTRLCRTASRQWRTTWREQGAPSAATFTIETWLAKTREWLQLQAERRCAMGMYAHWGECGDQDSYLNYDTGQRFQWAIITSRSKANMILQRGEEGQEATPVGQSYDINCEPEPPEYWKLVITDLSDNHTESEPLRDIAGCNVPMCAGACGALEDVCNDLVFVADAATGAIADVWFSYDSGATWAAGTAQPFTTDEDINSVVCFTIDEDTVRVIVQRGTTAVAAADVAYSDDGGATWINVIYGVANEYGMHSGGLFALSQREIWAGTDLGNIYFSSDAGITWVDQAAPDPAAGAEEIYYIHFADSHYGMACGDNQALWYTGDGGEHWQLDAAGLPGVALDVYTCCARLDEQRMWLGSTTNAGAGALYYTFDGGTVWNVRALPVATTNIGDMCWLDVWTGFVVGIYDDSGDDLIIIFRTFNGGFDWEHYIFTDDALDSSIVHQGANAVLCCSLNEAFVVGEPMNSLGALLTLTPVGSV